MVGALLPANIPCTRLMSPLPAAVVVGCKEGTAMLILGQMELPPLGSYTKWSMISYLGQKWLAPCFEGQPTGVQFVTQSPSQIPAEPRLQLRSHPFKVSFPALQLSSLPFSQEHHLNKSCMQEPLSGSASRN